MHRIESLLSARLFVRPQLSGDRIYFISNLSGHLSLYSMKYGGSVPEPLLPPHIALQNPHLLDDAESFLVFDQSDLIIVMVDSDGDENYQPMGIPKTGGYPIPLFNNFFSDSRVHLGACDRSRGLVYFSAESRTNPMITAYLGNIITGELIKLGESPYGSSPSGASRNQEQVVLIDNYSIGDTVLYLWEKSSGQRRLIYGKPLDQRLPGEDVPLSNIRYTHFVAGDRSLIFITSLFSDANGLGSLDLASPEEIVPVPINGLHHTGAGELTSLTWLDGDRYLLLYNIDGCSWLYEAVFDEISWSMNIAYVVCGQRLISNGTLDSVSAELQGEKLILSFSTATSPTQIYTVEGPDRSQIVRHTNERILGIPAEVLSPGEDASFNSFDGLRVSARLYLPAESLGHAEPYPVVYYIHGGPQSQERPDFAWFSMPLIQFLTLNGFAVFVPNVRGSSGYGMKFMKLVDNDWGGDDRLDHAYAVEHVLPNDKRLNSKKIGVVGRSYGGYMSLIQAGQHNNLWSAAVDMFGPYDLVTFSERIPATWKPYFKIILGDPEVPAEREFLIERSPRTHIDNLACPLLVIQGANDPRVVERESHDLVDHLRGIGKQVEYLVFDNEGHDVLKFENRVRCYNAITDFFKRHLS